MIANTIALLFNGLTLTLALGLLILILWQDPNSEPNRYFSLFLFMVLIWASGSLLGRAAAYVNAGTGPIQAGLRLLDIGFTGASISIYVYSAVIIGFQGRLFRTVAIVGLGMVFAYQALLVLSGAGRAYDVTNEGILVYSFDTPSKVLYFFLQAATILLVWQNRLKLRSGLLTAGILLFSGGQIVGLIFPQLRILGVAEDVSAVAALMMSVAVVRQQIMNPLMGRARQLEAVRDVGLAITSRLRLQETLATIAAQAAELLEADGAAIFLKNGAILELAAVFNLPGQYVGLTIPIGKGVVGTVALERRGRRVDHYYRDWRGEVDLPLGDEVFGAVICVPLMFAEEVVGVLLVIQGRQGQLFNQHDIQLLESLGPQAAVAITNSRLFEAERSLSNDLERAKNQLETVLTSTDNPVVAVDREFKIMFANPAAVKLLGEVDGDPVGQRIFDLVPARFLPSKPRDALRELYRRRSYFYEIVADAYAYFCYIAELANPQEGWVVVLNDVTQLKELDRLKSQMVQMTSHDLKNPLQAAMSYMELLEEDMAATLTDDMQDYLNMIWGQLTRMYRIISGILDLERVQSGTPDFEMCALEDALGRVVLDMADQARTKGLTLRLQIQDELPAILGDAQQLGQAFTNLVDNAIKFTAEGEVFVQAETEAEQVVVRVVDTGIGIPAHEQRRIFERFFRGGQSGNVREAGSGLGLSLVKAIVNSHNGEVEVESTLGQGTVFHVRLPVARRMGENV
jgi:two-component system, OmpR family, phosphate regulon sensor histidine kinase PhoR